jgi:hypothetical protein
MEGAEDSKQEPRGSHLGLRRLCAEDLRQLNSIVVDAKFEQALSERLDVARLLDVLSHRDEGEVDEREPRDTFPRTGSRASSAQE